MTKKYRTGSLVVVVGLLDDISLCDNGPEVSW